MFRTQLGLGQGHQMSEQKIFHIVHVLVCSTMNPPWVLVKINHGDYPDAHELLDRKDSPKLETAFLDGHWFKPKSKNDKENDSWMDQRVISPPGFVSDDYKITLEHEVGPF